MNDLPESSAALPSTTPPAAPAPSKPLWKPALLAITGLAMVAWLAHTALHVYHYVETDDAYVTGHMYQISPQINGQVSAVLAASNQTVKTGDVLVRLDPAGPALAVQKARDQFAQAKAQAEEARAVFAQTDTQIAEAEARAKQAEAQLGETEAQLNLARQNLARNEQLFSAGGIIAQSDLDSARSVFRTAEAAHTANQANLGAARAAVASAQAARDPLNAQIAAAAASVAVAQSALSDTERMLAYATIIAPADGRIGNRAVEEGNYVATGQILMSLASADTWIVANFKETQLTRIVPGQPVDVTVDTLPDAILHGTVDSIAPASGSQFALLPPDNATGNFNKVVQRVPVKILLDKDSLATAGPRLRLGLSVIVNVRVR